MEDNVQSFLSVFGKDVENEEVLDKIESLRSYHNYTSSDMANMLLTYLNSEHITKSTLTSEVIDNFEKQNMLKSTNDIKLSSNSIKCYERVWEPDRSFLGQYLGENNENIETTPLEDNYSENINTTPNTNKYIDEEFKEINWNIEISSGDKSEYKIMYQKNVELCNVIEKQGIEVCKSQLKFWNESHENDDANKLNFENLNPVGVHHFEEVYISGRITLDHSQTGLQHVENLNSFQFDDEYRGLESILNHSEKLKSENIAIQGYSEIRMALESLVLDQTDSYSFFPGQNVIVKGKNPSQSGFIVSSVLPRFVNPTAPINENEILGDLRVVIASGPFTSTTTNDLGPLTNLVKEMKTNRFHVLILIGPIVDNHNILVQASEEAYEKLCWDRLKYIAKNCVELHTHLIVVPSVDDATEIPVFPQPSFTAPTDYPIINNPFIHFAPNPAIIKIGPYTFGVSSVDILRHMSAQEISKSSSIPRIMRLCRHILAENNFYPLKPAHPELSIDWPLWFKKCGFGPTLPHCLILPSKLNTFLENVDGVVCINPGYLKKDNHRSTYCRIDISGSTIKDTFVDACQCKFVVL